MKKQLFFLAFVVLLGLSSVQAQKAYDQVFYTGKTQNITLLLTFAHGYMGASEIKTTDQKTKKTSKFLPASDSPDATGNIRFDHISVSGKKMNDYIVVNGLDDAVSAVPTSVNGYYFFNGKRYSFKLLKRK